MDNNRGRNKNEDLSNKNLSNESTRRSGSEGFDSSKGRSGSSDTSNIDKSGSRSDRGSMESENVRDRSSEEH